MVEHPPPADRTAAPSPGLLGSTLWRRLALGVVFAILVLAGLTLYADAPALARSLAAFPWPWLLPVLALTALNYGLRFIKWHYYLRLLEIRVKPGLSLAIFLSGFMMLLTPGKVGELVKSLLLRGAVGTPLTRSAPIVFAERLSDGLAMVFLAAVGLLAYPAGWPAVVVVLLVGSAVVVVLQYRRLAEAVFERLETIGPLQGRVHHLHTLYRSAYTLLRPRPLALAVGLGIVSWGGECLAFYLILLGVGADPGWTTLLQATFILASATIIGAGSMLPGGMGAAEGSILVLLRGTLAASAAGAATVLIRFCTLWFGVLLGALAFFLTARQYLLAVPPGGPHPGPLPGGEGKRLSRPHHLPGGPV